MTFYELLEQSDPLHGIIKGNFTSSGCTKYPLVRILPYGRPSICIDIDVDGNALISKCTSIADFQANFMISNKLARSYAGWCPNGLWKPILKPTQPIDYCI